MANRHSTRFVGGKGKFKVGRYLFIFKSVLWRHFKKEHNGEKGVCQVREVREKSRNSLYPLKSQGKVREFSEKSGKSQGILVKSRNLFLGTAN